MSTTQEISLDDLVSRVQSAALKMGKKNPNRLLLLNTAAALSSLGQQLEAAWDELTALKRVSEVITSSHQIVLTSGGIHRVN